MRKRSKETALLSALLMFALICPTALATATEAATEKSIVAYAIDSFLELTKDHTLYEIRLTWTNYDGTEYDNLTDNPKKILEDVVWMSRYMAVKSDGTLWGWGWDIILDYKGKKNQDTNYAVPPVRLMSGVKACFSDGEAYAVIKKDDSLWVWGEIYSRPITREHSMSVREGGEYIEYEKYTRPRKWMTNVSSMAIGGSHIIALKKDGSVWTCGLNNFGQLGDGTKWGSGKPIKVMEDVAAVAAGSDYSLALKKDGTLWGWGDNSEWQLGKEASEGAWMLWPVEIMGDVKAINAYQDSCMAIKHDGSLWAWGNNFKNVLGLGYASIGAPRKLPQKVMDHVKDVSLGSSFGVAVKTDGSLWAWGCESIGTITKRKFSSPVQIRQGAVS
jgi:alpha-tubulin suppressor-like RCC1 family protein